MQIIVQTLLFDFPFSPFFIEFHDNLDIKIVIPWSESIKKKYLFYLQPCFAEVKHHDSFDNSSWMTQMEITEILNPPFLLWFISTGLPKDVFLVKCASICNLVRCLVSCYPPLHYFFHFPSFKLTICFNSPRNDILW